MGGSRGPARRGVFGRLPALTALCLLAGCAAAHPPPVATAPPVAAQPATPPPAVETQGAPPANAAAPAEPLDPERIAARIAEIEAAQRTGGAADPDGAQAHELALLYTHPANRSPDYERALALMRTFLSKAAQAGRDPDVGRLTALLDAVGRLGRLLRTARSREKELVAQVESLQQREQNLEQREKDLLAENQALSARIEKLKALDLQMEKRRKSVR
jgi:hypothetical protein